MKLLTQPPLHDYVVGSLLIVICALFGLCLFLGASHVLSTEYGGGLLPSEVKAIGAFCAFVALGLAAVVISAYKEL